MESSPQIVPGQFDDVKHSSCSSDSEDIESESENCSKILSVKRMADGWSMESRGMAGDDDPFYDEDLFYSEFDDARCVGFDETVTGTSCLQPRKKVLGQNIGCSISVMDIGSGGLGGGGDRMAGKMQRKRKDKADRATVSQVLDERTRIIIRKMQQKGLFDEITGSISVGKEANVFRVEKLSPEGHTQYMALKVYKTSILSFKQRSKYVDGDWRYHRGYCKSNPRKMVRTWAEKEIKNLTRIHQAGLRCPTPILLKGHLLLMGFIGSENGAAAPRLKDADLSDDKLRELYLDLVLDMRKLYHECKLVHADLSEFNILYHEGKAYIIDVSQSVEHSNHPHALDFLRMDCTNITDFFHSRGVATMTVKELFDFVTDLTITDENLDSVLEAAMERTATRSYSHVTEADKVDEEVFKHAFIPRDLCAIRDHERDFEKQIAGQTDGMFYQTVTGMKTDLTGAQQIPRFLEHMHLDDGAGDDVASETTDDRLSTDSQDDGSEEKEKNEEGKGDRKAISGKRPKDESVAEKKERKKGLKEARRDKIKTKVPKHVKKRGERIGKK